MDFSVLEQMCKIHAPSGSEYKMTEFVLDYIQQNQANWNVQPTVLSNGDFQDSIILVFGKPKTAIFAHLDSIGFTVGYGSQLNVSCLKMKMAIYPILTIEKLKEAPH
jgi:putative aminopeptidase FrvX